MFRNLHRTRVSEKKSPGSVNVLESPANTPVNLAGSFNRTGIYPDGTTANFSQRLSDWAFPQHYAGESNAVGMTYRNASGGTPDNIPIYLYGYSFALNNAKTVSGLVLPNNSNVEVLAVTLMP